MFQVPGTNGGSPRLDVDREVKDPSRDWIRLDEHEGRERLWMVWSFDPVPAFEGIGAFVNERDEGAVADSRRATKIRDLLAERWKMRPTAEIDDE